MKISLSLFDLETLRLGYFQALRVLRNGAGKILSYFVIGQLKARPRLEKSVHKLLEAGLLKEEAGAESAIESRLEITTAGETIYRQFCEMEERGQFRKT